MLSSAKLSVDKGLKLSGADPDLARAEAIVPEAVVLEPLIDALDADIQELGSVGRA